METLDEALMHALNLSHAEAKKLARTLSGPRFEDQELRQP